MESGSCVARRTRSRKTPTVPAIPPRGKEEARIHQCDGKSKEFNSGCGGTRALELKEESCFSRESKGVEILDVDHDGEQGDEAEEDEEREEEEEEEVEEEGEEEDDADADDDDGYEVEEVSAEEECFPQSRRKQQTENEQPSVSDRPKEDKKAECVVITDDDDENDVGSESSKHSCECYVLRKTTRPIQHPNPIMRGILSLDSYSFSHSLSAEEGEQERSNGGREASVSTSEVAMEEEIERMFFSRKRALGIDVLVPTRETLGEAMSQGSGVAGRTRSRCPFRSTKKGGTFSRPFVLESSEEENPFDPAAAEDAVRSKKEEGSSSTDDAVSNSEKEEYDSSGSEVYRKNERIRKGKFSKRKQGRASKDDAFFKLLVNTVWGTGATYPEELNSSPPAEFCQPKVRAPEIDELMLQLKFPYNEEEMSTVREKSEMESLEDELWTKLDFAMRLTEMGSFESGVDSKETCAADKEMDQSILCQNGKHEYILNEKVGITCRYCGFLKVNIRHVFPRMVRNHWRKSGQWKHDGGEDPMEWDGSRMQDTYDDSPVLEILPPGTVWDIVPEARKTMHHHQREGFEFMWKNLAGSIFLRELKSSCSDVMGGCVISHAPGTGKTLLTIVFLQTFIEVFPDCRPIIVAPQNMLLSWEREFKKWNVNVPFHILNRKELSGKEDDLILKLFHKKRSLQRNMNDVRMVKLYSWNKGKSVLGLSYPLFQRLAENQNSNNEQSAQIAKILLEKPGLLVLDEGHTPRNSKSLIWKALVKIKTERRIILSGTPFQNNFNELYNVLCLVRPRFADSLSSRISGKSFMMPKRKRPRWEWDVLTSSIGKPTDDNLEELRSILDPFVHVYKGSILKNLPGLRESLVVLHPYPQQKQVLDSIQNIPARNCMGRECAVSLISVHPSLITTCSLSEEEESVIDKHQLERVRDDPNEGVKTRFVMELIRLAGALGEKVLVFSQYIEPLEFIKKHLITQFNWTEGKEVLQMDGSIVMKHRQSRIDSFNDPFSEVKVLLASTKACCEGINLTGASRVVLLDVVWNPSVERQAISRAYRLGQTKFVYTYHLIASGTNDEDKYSIQVKKERLSELVFSSTDCQMDNQSNPSKGFEDKILEEMVYHEKLKSMFAKISCHLKKTLHL
ncbi:SNF2 domain-containing protein CLASSY 3-like [Aristolochia californica]|uniref:SNF2 domain-containing protein CLASSY 3-like n=1 Tax=Aristolochia californica TaxID=171875 RepID=UPI0035DD69B5